MVEGLSSWLGLRGVKGLGAGSISRLVRHFGSAQAVQSASVHELTSEGGVSHSIAEHIRQSPDADTQIIIKREMKALEQGSHTIVTILDALYPARLKTIHDPPPFLYVSGQLEEKDHQAIAIVGSRHATPTGCAFTQELSRELASCGFTIVSGLARGIDRAAHQGALAGSGRTVAVLGCGIDRTYPVEHKALRAQMELQGAVVSEFPFGAVPHGYHFPQRNRVISGWTLGVVVAEAKESSGSLITARMAIEQDREVFAVPGAVTNELSRGPHQLIKQGAKLVDCVDDILEELMPQLEGAANQQRIQYADIARSPAFSLDKEEEELYDRITLEPIGLEELISQGTLSASEVMSLLLSLEMKGAVRQIPGSQYTRVGVR